ncbi:hypothetical protein Y032_0001g426 [Ancylostoma ceylanicum]|nr:hypothetical protein Y032_0001g426 [Ancylostoma ceylanicum]
MKSMKSILSWEMNVIFVISTVDHLSEAKILGFGMMENALLKQRCLEGCFGLAELGICRHAISRFCG